MVNWNDKPMMVARWLLTVPLMLALTLGVVQQSMHRHESSASGACSASHQHTCHAHPPLAEPKDSDKEHHGPHQRDESCAVCQFLAQTAAPGIWQADLPLFAAVWNRAEAECPAVRAAIVAFYSSRAPPLQSPSLDLA